MGKCDSQSVIAEFSMTCTGNILLIAEYWNQHKLHQTCSSVCLALAVPFEMYALLMNDVANMKSDTGISKRSSLYSFHQQPNHCVTEIHTWRLDEVISA